jgi:hypothetical protein
MNGREKSHSAIVAVKPTNKAGRPVAEPAEPRAGTGKRETRRQALDSEPGKRIAWPGCRTGRQQGAGIQPDLDIRFIVNHPR